MAWRLMFFFSELLVSINDLGFIVLQLFLDPEQFLGAICGVFLLNFGSKIILCVLHKWLIA